MTETEHAGAVGMAKLEISGVFGKRDETMPLTRLPASVLAVNPLVLIPLKADEECASLSDNSSTDPRASAPGRAVAIFVANAWASVAQKYKLDKFL